MSRLDLSKLAQPFRERFELLKEELQREHIDVLFYCGFRSCAEQARLWRSSRSTTTINATLAELDATGFGFLADVIRDVGPQYGSIGDHLTYAIPGKSCHNYGQAVDGVVMIDGKPDWEMHHWHLWEKYGGLAMRLGLSWAGSWKKMREYVHVEHNPPNPMLLCSPAEVRRQLEEIGGLNLGVVS
jgi:hypothetical protein